VASNRASTSLAQIAAHTQCARALRGTVGRAGAPRQDLDPRLVLNIAEDIFLGELGDTNADELQEKRRARTLEACSSALTSWRRPAPRA
jgi:hypothetical protein